MVARVGEAIKKEMVLERMEEDKKEEEEEEEVRRRTDGIDRAQTEGVVAVLERNFGRKTEGQREEKNSVARSFGYVLIFRCV